MENIGFSNFADTSHNMSASTDFENCTLFNLSLVNPPTLWKSRLCQI